MPALLPFTILLQKTLINIPSLSQLTVLTVMLYRNFFLLRFPIWYAARFQHTSFSTPFVTFTNEWKMLIATSALLLASNLGILQLPGVMSDRLIRTSGFMSVAFASISILFSVILVFYCSALRREPNATTEAGGESAERSADRPTNDWPTILNIENESCVWWNASILVALPVIWTSWSAIYFAVVLLLLLWYIRVEVPTNPEFQDLAQRSLINAAEYMPSVAATVVLVIGGVYLVLVISTFRSRIVQGGA